MKKFYTLLFILTLSEIAPGQEFSFKMYFQDSAGNKDSLTIGYDVNATDSIDASFGETNIISTPLNTGLDVRITNELLKRQYQLVGTFHTKKQITKDLPYINVDIFTNHWPVTASWNSSLFNNSCCNGSLFASVPPASGWDYGSPSDLFRVYLNSTDQVTFTSNFTHDYYSNQDNFFAYTNNSNDTISCFWVAFGDLTSWPTSINKSSVQKDIKIFPNPTSNYLSIQPTNPNLIVEAVQLLDLSGKEQHIKLERSLVNLEDISDGLYFMRLTLQNGETVMRKIIKK